MVCASRIGLERLELAPAKFVFEAHIREHCPAQLNLMATIPQVEDLAPLSMKEIIACLKGVLTFSQEECQKKELLLEKVMKSAPPEQIEFLHNVALQKKGGTQHPTVHQKHKREHVILPRRTAQCLDKGDEELDEEDDRHEPSKYLALPTEEEHKACYRRFYEVTSGAATSTGICGVCTRECGAMEESLNRMALSDGPNSYRLVFKTPHPAHDIYDGRLLQLEVVETDGQHTFISVCQACLDELWKPGDKPPQCSLANNLWVGWIPWQLQGLTFPEQLLIAHFYPHVFVLKLFPKRQGSVRQASGLQNALRGNVSTYDMSIDGIASHAKTTHHSCIISNCDFHWIGGVTEGMDSLYLSGEAECCL